jgi:hypothetical protein
LPSKRACSPTRWPNRNARLQWLRKNADLRELRDFLADFAVKVFCQLFL